MSYLCFQYKVNDVPVGTEKTKNMIEMVGPPSFSWEVGRNINRHNRQVVDFDSSFVHINVVCVLSAHYQFVNSLL